MFFMIVRDLNALWSLVRADGFFEALCAGNPDWDSMLDARDEAGFDEQWTQHRLIVQSTPLTGEVIENITLLREWVFKNVFSVSDNAELAGYVSDDFGLIAYHLESNTDSAWVTGLLDAYVHNQFPHSP
ncbi:hypothetical protein [Pseudomonas sp. ICMP 561]|uniref:hypothetical protein n=1 Tax=Pseudomonas sp. ICMP 561 TaxID=1718918 RepID=UPI00211D5B2C|nr:hypothetical protein [Pseudomonas sp. ICMP 561]